MTGVGLALGIVAGALGVSVEECLIVEELPETDECLGLKRSSRAALGMAGAAVGLALGLLIAFGRRFRADTDARRTAQPTLVTGRFGSSTRHDSGGNGIAKGRRIPVGAGSASRAP
jgi:hypothetical protein